MSVSDMNQIKAEDDQADFVASFVAESSDDRDDMEDIWDESERNFLVRPFSEETFSTRYPLGTGRGVSTGSGYSVLKDPETHQEVMAIVSKVVGAVFPDGEFLKARPVGFEDALKADLVTKLEHYYFRLPQQYTTNIQYVMSSGIYGTGIKEVYWHYALEPRMVRTILVDPLSGMEISHESLQAVAVYDDPMACNVDIRDFYPAKGCTSIENCYGMARRFKITALEAMRRAAQGIYDKEAVIRAINNQASPTDSSEESDKPETSSAGIGRRDEIHPEFVGLIGYCYYGETPFRSTSDDPKYPTEITTRRQIVVLAGETVRSEVWPRRAPFFDTRVIPRLGSFWGIAPAEVIQRDQDFADVLKMMLADAVVRSVHPPHIYDKNADLDIAKLMRWRPGVPVGANSIAAVAQIPYNPPVGPAFQMYSGTKQQMREATGALGVVQGIGLGVDRASATEAGNTFKMALDRPELYSSLLEKNDLPPEAKYVLKLYQEILPENDPTEIQRRVGQSAYPVKLSDIMAEFDVEFVGSRQQGTRNEQIAAFREIIAASANPMLGPLIPYIPILRQWFEKMGLPDIAAMVGNPQLVQLNTMLTQIGGGTGQQAGNNNGEMPANPTPGMMPAQEAGYAG